MSQVEVHSQHTLLCQEISHPRSLVPILHLSLFQVQLLTQANHLAINSQTFHLQSHHPNIMIILALYHHMSLSGRGILVQHLHLFQAKVHLLVHIKPKATNCQGCHPQPHQKSLITIIDLAHPMYQVELYSQLQVLYQPISDSQKPSSPPSLEPSSSPSTSPSQSPSNKPSNLPSTVPSEKPSAYLSSLP